MRLSCIHVVFVSSQHALSGSSCPDKLFWPHRELASAQDSDFQFGLKQYLITAGGMVVIINLNAHYLSLLKWNLYAGDLLITLSCQPHSWNNVQILFTFQLIFI